MPVPTLKVLLDDGTGTFPIDITPGARLVEGYSISGYGRSDNYAQPSPASLTLTIDNTEGWFSSGAGFGTGGFGMGPFGGVVAYTPGTTLIRITQKVGVTTSSRFTGTIQSVVVSWPHGGQESSVATLTATDLLTDLSRRPMRSMLEQEILLDAPTAYYTLGEAQGSTSGGDTSSNAAASLTMTGSGAAPTFGTGVGPPGSPGLPAAQFFGGQYLQVTTPTDFFRSSAAWTVECWVTMSAVPAATVSPVQVGSASINIDSSGRPSYAGIFGSNICDGKPHQIALARDAGTGLATLFVDGQIVNSVASSAGAATTLLVGGSVLPSTMTGTLSHVATYASTLTPTRILAHYGAGAGVTETTTARFARIAAYGGATTAVSPPMADQLMPLQDTAGQSMLEALQAVADAEGGVLYVNGSGTLLMQGRYYRSARTTADLTLGEQEPGVDTAVTWDTAQKVNRVTVTRTNGATQIASVAGLASSAAIFPAQLDLTVDTDANALGAAQWMITKRATTAPRFGDAITFDLLTSSSSEAILGLALGSRLALSALPVQMWIGVGDFVVEGWTETYTLTSWTLQANLLPWSQYTVFILDDATYGVLDSATPIGY